MGKEQRLQAKEQAGWQCQKCGCPCRKGKESADQFRARLQSESPQWLRDEAGNDRPIGAFTLVSVDTINGYIALCSGCALCYVRPSCAHPAARQWRLEMNGQLTLPLDKNES